MCGEHVVKLIQETSGFVRESIKGEQTTDSLKIHEYEKNGVKSCQSYVPSAGSGPFLLASFILWIIKIIIAAFFVFSSRLWLLNKKPTTVLKLSKF